MSNILEQMLEESKKQLELEFEHKKELAQIKSSQNNEVKELKEKYKKKITDLEAKLAQHEKHNAWVLEFLEKYQIDTELTPEYSENPIIEYCEQVNDFRAVDNKIIEDLQEEKETLRISQSSTHKTLMQLNDELLKTQKQLAKKDVELNKWSTEYARAYVNRQNDLIAENVELKQQLEEKEKELHYKTAECKKWKADYENCSKLEKIMTKEHQYCLDNWRASEQYKIEFTIEQLEKVKEFVVRQLFIITKDCSDLDEAEAKGCNELREETIEEIDNQIKELKGEK